MVIYFYLVIVFGLERALYVFSVSEFDGRFIYFGHVSNLLVVEANNRISNSERSSLVTENVIMILPKRK